MALEPVWTQRRTEKSLFPPGTGSLLVSCPAPVLCWLSYPGHTHFKNVTTVIRFITFNTVGVINFIIILLLLLCCGCHSNFMFAAATTNCIITTTTATTTAVVISVAVVVVLMLPNLFTWNNSTIFPPVHSWVSNIIEEKVTMETMKLAGFILFQNLASCIPVVFESQKLYSTQWIK